MTDEEEVKDEPLVSMQPSRKEVEGYAALAASHSQLVLVACTFEGKDRYAVAQLTRKGKVSTVAPIALMLNETDVVYLRQNDGELLPTPESELLIN